ncbi:ATPase histidine kinase DNA gyrase B HSP90 domain protein [Levilactobacillus koreensis JCM 16448]|uniref:Sensor histidine kinase n=1 Tax=Levilactobacillus koreensis TaxID=637971 RepID=A0AAC8UV04_9LACO|nr:sensor histidine kinase [Levilactobacillus koreensis]AKP64367.1 histidine kinase [Levilactobacillus koreensis]KRK88502.1 ATPase histidine kinase DNA gyrase B HSP90 domain protein [Levilactobacillus koreensis JCM 16448]
MLETNTWIQQYFDEATDAVLIFKEDDLVVSNQIAQDLEQELHLDPTYLVQVADASVKQKFSATDNCFNCAIRNSMQEISIPITLAKDMPHPLKYFMIYHVINADEHVFSLTLKNRGTIERMDQLAQQRQLNQYVNRAHEEERKKISADLHDSIAQGVYSAIMGVRRINEDDNDEAAIHELTQVIETQLNDTLAEVKGMALDIRPSVLDSFGLLPALRVLAKRLQENSGVTITVSGNASTEGLATDVQNVLYRIGQESINNALKHAAANEINLLLVAHNHFIILEIIDDGKGFDLSQHQGFNGHSLGLLNMNERVKALNGAFEIKSQAGAGTTVTAKFPVSFA